MMLDMIDEQGDEDSFKLNMDNVKAILMVKTSNLGFAFYYVQIEQLNRI